MKKPLTLSELEQQLESRSKELQAKVRMIEEQSLKDWRSDLEKLLREELNIIRDVIENAGEETTEAVQEAINKVLSRIEEYREKIEAQEAANLKKVQESVAWMKPAALAITALVMFIAGIVFTRAFLFPETRLQILDPAKIAQGQNGSLWYPVDQIPDILFKTSSKDTTASQQ